MIRIEKYNIEKKDEWDSFVSVSKNGTFLFYRNYMDYHSDRFVDHSLMFYYKNVLIALFPANISDNILYSHQGLSYGGFLSCNKMKAKLMLNCFDELINYSSIIKCNSIVYKVIPYIYHKYASEEDLYALFRNNAKLIRRDISSTIALDNKIEFNTLRKRMVKKATRANIEIEERESPDQLYPILVSNLEEKHATTPVHSIKELIYLKNKFPENIHFYTAQQNEKPLAGIMLFETLTTAHIQYIASLSEGRNIGALDAIFYELINKNYHRKKYFDFGISTENEGQHLNLGLIDQKEMFGGRGVCYDTYEIIL